LGLALEIRGSHPHAVEVFKRLKKLDRDLADKFFDEVLKS